MQQGSLRAALIGGIAALLALHCASALAAMPASGAGAGAGSLSGLWMKAGYKKKSIAGLAAHARSRQGAEDHRWRMAAATTLGS